RARKINADCFWRCSVVPSRTERRTLPRGTASLGGNATFHDHRIRRASLCDIRSASIAVRAFAVRTPPDLKSDQQSNLLEYYDQPAQAQPTNRTWQTATLFKWHQLS